MNYLNQNHPQVKSVRFRAMPYHSILTGYMINSQRLIHGLTMSISAPSSTSLSEALMARPVDPDGNW
ncbi:hypothetical protein BpHYR1_011297 [Brachionus plicatilis]|uniref:Uncharacterized protein n=1 Tax=Brachionus plicatilis TaxID=10195 RepID=A0A3M7QTC1_BRAPC|nr:hypothetical protein BpHYR1_011297 [Brachionus plicatilis]